MSMRGILIAFILMLGIAGCVRASEEEVLSWSEVRIAGPEREDTGRVMFTAKTAGEQYQEVAIEAFGKKFSVSKEDLQKMNGMPLNSLVITHEAGYESIGGHTVYFKMKRVFYDKAGGLTEERLVLPVSRGKGLAAVEQKQQVLKEGR
jgi:hypothetical protein